MGWVGCRLGRVSTLLTSSRMPASQQPLFCGATVARCHAVVLPIPPAPQVKGHIAKMALCLEDEDARISALAQLFFHELAKKEYKVGRYQISSGGSGWELGERLSSDGAWARLHSKCSDMPCFPAPSHPLCTGHVPHLQPAARHPVQPVQGGQPEQAAVPGHHAAREGGQEGWEQVEKFEIDHGGRS